MHLVSKKILEKNNTWLSSVHLIKGRSKVQLSHQLLESIERALELGAVKKGEILPSINELSSYFDISRWTVEKMFNDLKKKGLIDSVPGKGYFLSDISKEKKYNVLISSNYQNETNTVITSAIDTQSLITKINSLSNSQLTMILDYLEKISNEGK
jgi:DNA-binding transcriptional regulator YhcF (GntR family)